MSRLISKKLTLTSNKNIHFHIDNGLKKEHISEVNQVKEVSSPLAVTRLKTIKLKNKQFMPTMIKATPPPRARATTAAATKTTPIATTIMTLTIPLHQIHH